MGSGLKQASATGCADLGLVISPLGLVSFPLSSVRAETIYMSSLLSWKKAVYHEKKKKKEFHDLFYARFWRDKFLTSVCLGRV